MATCTTELDPTMLSVNVTCAVPVKSGLAFVGAIVHVAVPVDCDVTLALKSNKSETMQTNTVAPVSEAVTVWAGLVEDANCSDAGVTDMVPPDTSTSTFAG